MTKEAIIFCERCGKQFTTIDEMAECICESCNSYSKEGNEDQDFYCWACEKRLTIMSEVAQGICQNCKSSIIRKLNPRSNKKIINLIFSDAGTPQRFLA
jgi:DNA-directed RNA polymerase subunit RPC12/RpoP